MERIYRQWSGNPKGVPEDKTKCIQVVWEKGRGALNYQCTRKRGHGPDSLYCKQHGKEAEQREKQRRTF